MSLTGLNSSIENIPNVIFRLMRVQKRQKLRLEIDFLVMFGLVIYVPDRSRLFTYGNRERTIPLLPCKIPVFRESIMYPFRGTAFDQLHSFRDRNCFVPRDQQMTMIIHAARMDELHSVLTSDSANIREKP